MKLEAFRHGRLDLAAKNAGCDLVVASLPANILYTCSYTSVGQHVLHRTQSYAVYVPGENRVIYVMSLAEIPSIVEHAGMDAEIFCFGSFRFSGVPEHELTKLVKTYEPKSFGSPEEALIAAIQSTGRTSVALDESRVSVASWAKIAEGCPDVHIAPGSDVFMQARMIKHADEIEGIAKSAQIAEQALMAAIAQWKPGMTERELENIYSSEICIRGAEPYFYVGTADLRAAYSDTTNTSLVMKQFIRFDFGCLYKGYCSDLARTASIGKPDEKVLTYYNALRDGTREAIKAMKPGVTAGELFDIAVSVTRERGIPHYERHHVGHGIGLEAYDSPTVAAGVGVTLEKDMTFCIETPYYELGWGGLQIEDTVAVTDDGVRYLDLVHSSDELIIIEA